MPSLISSSSLAAHLHHANSATGSAAASARRAATQLAAVLPEHLERVLTELGIPLRVADIRPILGDALRFELMLEVATETTGVFPLTQEQADSDEWEPHTRSNLSQPEVKATAASAQALAEAPGERPLALDAVVPDDVSHAADPVTDSGAGSVAEEQVDGPTPGLAPAGEDAHETDALPAAEAEVSKDAATEVVASGAEAIVDTAEEAVEAEEVEEADGENSDVTPLPDDIFDPPGLVLEKYNAAPLTHTHSAGKKEVEAPSSAPDAVPGPAHAVPTEVAPDDSEAVGSESPTSVGDSLEDSLAQLSARTPDVRNPFAEPIPNMAEHAAILARAMASDLALIHPDRMSRAETAQDEDLRALWASDIAAARKDFERQVGRDVAMSTTVFEQALNRYLAGGRRIFG